MQTCPRHSDLAPLLDSRDCPVCATKRLTEISNAAFQDLQSTIEELRAALETERNTNARLVAALSQAAETINRLHKEMISFRMMDSTMQ